VKVATATLCILLMRLMLARLAAQVRAPAAAPHARGLVRRPPPAARAPEVAASGGVSPRCAISPRSRVGLISMTSTFGPGLSDSVSANRKTHPIRYPPAGNGPTGHIACVLIPHFLDTPAALRKSESDQRVVATESRKLGLNGLTAYTAKSSRFLPSASSETSH